MKRGRWDNATSRGEAQTLLLSMLYALLDSSPIIETKHLNSALALWRYCDDSARIVFGGSETEGGKLEQRIRQAVSKQPGVMRSELRTSLFKNGKTSEFDNALTWLIQRNEIVCVSVMEGRQADRYYPAVPDISVNREKLRKRENENATETPIAPEPPTKYEIVNNPTNNNYSEIEIEDVEDTELTTDEFIYQLEKRLHRTNTKTPSLSFGDILDWRNKHAIDFVQAGKECVIVRQEQRHLMTPEIENAIACYGEQLYPLARA